MALPNSAMLTQLESMALKKVREIRAERDISLESLAHDIGISASQLSRLETGEREPRVDEVKRLSNRLGVPLLELIGEEETEDRCPIVGMASAGSDSIIFSAGQGPFDYVEAPEGSSEATVAVEIRGQSLGPIFEGWLAFYDDLHNPPTGRMIGHLCVAQLADGRVVIKRLMRGQRADRFNLLSNVEPPIYDAKVAWAARVIEMRPKSQTR